MLIIRFDEKDIPSVSKSDELLLKDGLDVLPMKEMFENRLCLFPDFAQLLADFLEGGAGSVQNLPFCIDYLKNLLFQGFQGR